MIIDMSKYLFNGDVIDISKDNYNIIYNVIKYAEDEISIDYIEEEYDLPKDNKFNSCVCFLTIGKINTTRGKEKILKKASKFLREDGYIYLWDVLKEKRESLQIPIKVLMPNNEIKLINYTNKNIFCENKERDFKSIVDKYFEIEETKISEKIIFIKAKMKGTKKDENIINSN
ncbi:hypothetical protein [Inconstantimicrobium mannanitabidum]|uniref:Uncharacterized protein n=1 Tax=Inconstantimicrobium mannanitabidum TaxID=1604901 RepID=A0ACB5RC93_9CLOT|nr:hypothetical protein [Clostridium sp. TW13]GKX66869.1 hypothetical protein rsdtw13_21270 [Clostridium sp. TW13]